MGPDTTTGAASQNSDWPIHAAGQQWAALTGITELATRVQDQANFLTRAGITPETVRRLVTEAAAENRSILERPHGLTIRPPLPVNVSQASLARVHVAYPGLVHQVGEATGWSARRVRHELVLELTALATGRGEPLTPAIVAPMTPMLVAGFTDAAAAENRGR